MSKKIIIVALLAAVTLSGCTAAGRKTSSNPNDGGVYKSINASDSWVQAVDVLATKGQVVRFGSENVNTLALDPQDHEVIFAGTEGSGLLYSLDGGNSWTQDKFLKDKNVVSIAIDYFDKCTWVVALSTKVYRTLDCGRGWREMLTESREGYRFVKVLTDHFNKYFLYAINNKELLKSTDFGETWQTMERFTKDIQDAVMDRFDSRVILLATKGDGVRKTSDGGATWTDSIESLKQHKNALNVKKVVQDVSKRNTYMIANDYGLFKSADGGNIWSPMELLTPPDAVDIRSIAIDTKNGDVLYYATDSTFYKSIDNGATWKNSRLPHSRRPSSLLVDFIDPNVIYMATKAIPK